MSSRARDTSASPTFARCSPAGSSGRTCDSPQPRHRRASRPDATHVGPGVTRPFRFIAPMPRLREPVGAWLDSIRRIEDLGFSSVAISDHFTQGWVMDPIVAMTAAVQATERLRVLSLVLGNDYRHPVMVHKAFANLDVISGGRVELGLGAGWRESDYEAAGLPFDRPGVRLARLEESLQVIIGLFGDDPFSFQGGQYR